MKLEIPNPVHCAVCINLGRDTRAETIVKGYSVCVNHSILIDRHDTLRDAILEAARTTPGDRAV